MSSYNSKLQLNNTTLQTILSKINDLPEESGGIELPELTEPATEDEVFLNQEYIDANGEKKSGTFTIDAELSTQAILLSDQDTKIAELAEILSNKASVSPILQSKTIIPTASEQTVTADSGYDGLNKVTVNGDENLVSENIAEGVSIFGVEGSHSGGSGSAIETCTVTLKASNMGMHMFFTTIFDQNSNRLSHFSQLNVPNPYVISNVVCGTILVLKADIPVLMGYSVTGGAELISDSSYTGWWIFYIPQYPSGDITITVRDDD